MVGAEKLFLPPIPPITTDIPIFRVTAKEFDSQMSQSETSKPPPAQQSYIFTEYGRGAARTHPAVRAGQEAYRLRDARRAQEDKPAGKKR